jgi:HlyD family secretion protein
MPILNRLYGWYGKRVVWGFFAAVILLVGIGIFLRFAITSEKATESDAPPLVRVQSVSGIAGESAFTVVGSVTSINEAHLQTESAGRVTSVRVGIGDTVRGGDIIATLENASQAAAVLQAEGSYEAALAAAATSEVGEASAQTSLAAALESGVGSYRSAFIAADSAIRTTADQIISTPRGPNPGLQIEGFGRAPALSDERIAIEELLRNWSRATENVSAENVEMRLPEAQSNLERIRQFIEDLSHLVDRQRLIDLSESQKAALQASFLSTRNTLASQREALSGARTAIENAEEALLRAQIASANGTVSAASAQVKQALGSLRAAQANYAKTIIRTPIAGAVNSVDIAAGDYVNAFTSVATIANNNALKITAHVNETERAGLQAGQEVLIEGGITGRIARVAPAVDPQTGKAQIEIQTESSELTNGDTVSISITESAKRAAEKPAATDIIIPISALKVETDRIVIFTVSGEGRLIAHEITEGPLLGNSIIVRSGLTPDMEIVLDARGLNEGDEVIVAP